MVKNLNPRHNKLNKKTSTIKTIYDIRNLHLLEQENCERAMTLYKANIWLRIEIIVAKWIR